jgi:hypothetical protein
MKTIFRIPIIICLLIAITNSSCSNDNDETTPAPVSTDVYIGGSTRDGNNDQVPTIWKNGVPTILPSSPGVQTIVEKIVVSGNDVYALNSSFNELGNILLWKNGILVQTIPNNLPVDLKVENNDVYILGRSGNVFKYWKNGDETILTNNSIFNQVYNMEVANGIVYIAGSEQNGNINIAKLWKNGAATIISSQNLNTYVNDLDVNVNDVAVLLRETSLSNKISLKTWKNGTINTLETGIFNDFSFGNGVVQMSSNDIYVSAKVPLSASSSKIVFWKNNIKSDITSGASTSSLFDMKVKGSDANILFSEKNPTATGKMVLNLSKNGQTTILTTDVQGDVLFAAMSISNNGNVHLTALNKYFINNTSFGLEGLFPRTFSIFTVN